MTQRFLVIPTGWNSVEMTSFRGRKEGKNKKSGAFLIFPRLTTEHCHFKHH